jgi:regulator of RNase E activity RraA
MRRFPAIAALAAAPLAAQIGMFTNEQRTAMTSQWKGERFPDGRPKVPDAVLDRLKTTTAEEAWGTMRRFGYNNQFEGNWKTVNVAGIGTENRLVGRVVTGVFFPFRPDLNAYVVESAKKEGRSQRGLHNAWVIDTLVQRDVMVIDLFGKIANGTIIGDNLGTSIMTKTGTGLVVDGAVRDVSGLSEIKGFRVFARGFHPSALTEATLVGLNTPIRIGNITVMPGDVVISDPEGLTFIPAHLAETVADESELTQLRDKWGHEMLRTQQYSPGQIDSNWSEDMVNAFNAWAEKQGSKMRMKPRGRQ